ncbi:hypothetical protein BDD12DRAFT_801284 [Trichophaea hybrida]|nr:hypothetical protein BDD12DRAFT_801284 [Trichophaea hybrida]
MLSTLSIEIIKATTPPQITKSGNNYLVVYESRVSPRRVSFTHGFTRGLTGIGGEKGKGVQREVRERYYLLEVLSFWCQNHLLQLNGRASRYSYWNNIVSNMENLLKKALLASKGCQPYHNLNYLPSTQPLLASWAAHYGKMFGGDSDGDSPKGSRVKLGPARVSLDAYEEMGLDLENRKVLPHYL